MDVDYPAGHSQDSYWFAVDRNGHVAMFDTGETGAVPEDFTLGHDESLDVLYRLFEVLQSLRNPEPGGQPRNVGEEGTELGVFVYTYGEGFDQPAAAFCADVYHRAEPPADPIHVDQLPPEFRTLCKRFSLNVLFADSERVQPFEHFPCSDYGVNIAYLRTDGTTVQVVPGQEKAFAKFLKSLTPKQRKLVETLKIEGAPSQPARKKAPPKKRKKEEKA
jgi:hypothetical protein